MQPTHPDLSQRCHHRRARRGFTLAELMVVVLIMGILSTLGISAFRREMNQSKKTEALAGLRAIGAAQESFRADNGVYLSVSTNLSTYYPPTTPAGGTQHFWGHTGSANWQRLAPEIPQLVSFSYASIAGLPLTPPPSNALDANITGNITWPNPQDIGQPWYVVSARGDSDGDGRMAYFVMASFDSKVYQQEVNE